MREEEETGWLIEHPNDPRYQRESWYAGKIGFTIDSLQAVRYARREDACREVDRFPLSLVKNLRVTEHAWCGTKPMVEQAAKTDGSMKNILHQWATPYGHVRLVDGPRPAGMGMELLNAERGEWGPCAPMELMFTKEILRLLCEVRRLVALYDGERKLRERDRDQLKIEAESWRQQYENLLALWRVIGDSLVSHGYARKDDSSDVWPARVEGLLKEVEALRQRENQFAQVLKDRESSVRDLLKERADQTNHAIMVNREEAGQAGYDRALQDIGYTVSVGMIAAERRRQVEGESWTSAHDDGHDAGQIALAAACYAIESAGRDSVEYRLGHAGGIEINVDALGLYWPFDRDWWKPGNPIRNLVKAGALIAAEIDRRLRAGEEP